MERPGFRPAATALPRPNVLLITMDQLASDPQQIVNRIQDTQLAPEVNRLEQALAERRASI